MNSYDECVFTKKSKYSENFIFYVFHSLLPLPTVKIVSMSDTLMFFLSLLIMLAYNEYSSYTVSTELFVNENSHSRDKGRPDKLRDQPI
ncbi:MAG: hypothetical protein LKE52_01815 [Bacilli bacterium]|nr:hypothetical protein [Bacilli bacterium]